jgi:adenine-specific DNA-methyltransferase
LVAVSGLARGPWQLHWIASSLAAIRLAARVSIETRDDLLGVAAALGVAATGTLSSAERRLLTRAPSVSNVLVDACRRAIDDGEDPLGAAFGAVSTRVERRPLGATYTPLSIVRAMVACCRLRSPARVVDPGAGSGRFLVEAGRRFSEAELLAVEIDPLASLALRAHVAAAGFAGRTRIVTADYRSLRLPAIGGPTLFIGNPPYVRHHDIEPHWKDWLRTEARAFGLVASRLAGLHAHFFLQTARLARSGDAGVFITAAEWLDVNYGSLVRRLFLERLGGHGLELLDPRVRAFADADATAVISGFEVGARPESVTMRRVQSVAGLGRWDAGRRIAAEHLAQAARWTPLTRPNRKPPSDFVELGELCRVHRGQVTGANRVWIAGPESELPERCLFPSVTRARELFAAGGALSDVTGLRQVIDLPHELDQLSVTERRKVERFLRAARLAGADRGFIASHRKAWWSVGLREPAPILATYMARRPPAFVRNLCGARHLNIAHGLYPRDPLSPRVLDALARHLSTATELRDGRTYAGGLTKFEPKEMERLLVPSLERLRSDVERS